MFHAEQKPSCIRSGNRLQRNLASRDTREIREGAANMAGLWSYVIHDDRCRRCGKCMAVCPTGAISIPQGDVVTTSYGTVSIDAGLCSACGQCIAACKLHAISKKLKPRF